MTDIKIKIIIKIVSSKTRDKHSCEFNTLN